MKRMIAFDLDGTLAESKQPIGKPMAAALKALLDVASVAVISGGDWPQFETQVVERLPKETALDRLFIMPTTGTKLYRFDGTWRAIYAEVFGEAERTAILAALDTATTSIDLNDKKIWGERVEDRGSQITFSGLGQQAPIDENVRRQIIWRKVRLRLAECGPRLGVDVRRRACGVASADVRWSFA